MKRRAKRDAIEQQQQQQLTESGLQNHDHDSKLAESLFKLSVKDRSAIEEEVHGVCCMAREETPEFLQESLRNFHSKLAEIDSKPAYVRAQEILAANPSEHPPSYIHARGLKLSFLRCELFDIGKAAKRYCKYLDLIFELYGEIALRRPIRMSDLSRDEMFFLREGRQQIMPYRDRSGRRVMCVVGRRTTPYVSKSPQYDEKLALIRVLLYVFEGVFGDNDFDHLETQQKGLVGIINPTYQQHSNEEKEREVSHLRMVKTRNEANCLVGSVIPLRVAAIHICLPKSTFAKLVSSLFIMNFSNWLPRIKFHFGNPIELRYQLHGYGIPTELIPATESGNIKSVHLKQCLKLREYLERQAYQQEVLLESSESDGAVDSASTASSLRILSHTTQIVECPGSQDVIFKRGKSMSYHFGNVKFQNLIESKIYEHTIDPNTTCSRRLTIEKELIQQIRDGGGRFLKWETHKEWWETMSSGSDSDGSRGIDKKIQTKVHYAFRDYRKRMLKTHKPIAELSSTYAFERQDGQKQKRYSNSNSANNNTSNECSIGNGCLSMFYNLNGGLETFDNA